MNEGRFRNEGKRRTHRHHESHVYDPHVYDPMEAARELEAICGKLRARADLAKPDETRAERETYQDMMYHLAQDAEQLAIGLVRWFILTRPRSSRAPLLSNDASHDRQDDPDKQPAEDPNEYREDIVV